MRRKTAQGLAPSTVAASVSSSGIDCSAPSADEEHIGESEPQVDEQHRELRQRGIGQPRDGGAAEAAPG